MLRPRGRRHTRGMSLIVVATDGSPAAGAALDEALRLAQATGDTVAVLAVWRALQGDFGLPYPSAALLGELLDAEHAYAERLLAEARERALAAGVEVETVLQAGDPAERICAFAEERDARLIAIGTHGYRPALALLTGSVSTAVIRRAPCPVLVVREPEAEAVPATPDRLAANG